MSAPRTKQGEHGTLYRYSIEYDDGPCPDGYDGFPPAYWSCWAYDREHAIESFHDDGQGFRPVKVARQTTAGQHRWAWHAV